MRDIQLDLSAMVMTNGSTRGAQPKYYEKGFWYKQNIFGYEGLAEYLASVVLKNSNVQNYVSYKQCKINGRDGCVSKNFLKTNEDFFSFQKIYEIFVGGTLQEKMVEFDTPKDRINYVIDFILKHLDFNCKSYLSKILPLDFLLLNSDRHFNNLGVIINRETGKVSEAPIFDNGDSLLSNYSKYPTFIDNDSYQDVIEEVTGMPFSSSLEAQAFSTDFLLKINYKTLIEDLEKEKETRALTILKLQLKRLESLFRDDSIEIGKRSENDKHLNSMNYFL